MSTNTYSVKLKPETEKEWEHLIKRIETEKGCKSKNDIYVELLNIINGEKEVLDQELTGYIDAINSSLDAIKLNIAGIDKKYIETVANNKQILKDAKAGLVSQLEETAEARDFYKEKLNESQIALEKAQERIKNLEQENKELRSNKETQEEILELLAQIKDQDTSNRGNK